MACALRCSPDGYKAVTGPRFSSVSASPIRSSYLRTVLAALPAANSLEALEALLPWSVSVNK
jgi:hypothetical protein